MSCSPPLELQQWCLTLQEEGRSQSLAVPGCESPRRPLSRTVPGPPRAPRWHGARLPTAALGDPRVPAPLTSAAAGASRWAPAACTGQGQGNTRGAVGMSSGSCCKQPQARPGTAQLKPCSTSKPRGVAQHDPGTSQTEPGSAGAPV